MSRKNGIIYCNCCGRNICEVEKKDKTSFLSIQKEWGYFSDKKDGLIHCMDICEKCCKTLAATFVIPPDEKKVTEFV